MAEYDPIQQSKAAHFHEKMVEYIDEYRMHILLVEPVSDVTNHLAIVQEFVNYLWGYHLITEIDEITISVANSKFHAYFKVHYPEQEPVPKQVVKDVLKNFFTFLYGKHGIKNEKIMKGFEKR